MRITTDKNKIQVVSVHYIHNKERVEHIETQTHTAYVRASICLHTKDA